jgi:hypothetical protein
MDNRPQPITVNYDQMKTAGSIEIIPQEMGGFDVETLARCVIAPAVMMKEDGAIEIIGWSLIPGWSYDKNKMSLIRSKNAKGN